MKLLLVEDEAIVAMDEEQELKRYGYEVMINYTSTTAITTIKNDPSIDLVLMDIDLGKGMDGAETAEVILRNRDLPILFLTSHTEPALVEKTERVNSYGLVVKEAGISVLNASIKTAVKLFEQTHHHAEEGHYSTPL